MGGQYFKRPPRNYTGLWLTIIVVLLIFGWRLLVIACGHEPQHWFAIATELGSVPNFKQDLWPNGAGTRLVYCQDTERGVGIYFSKTDSEESKLLCEQIEKNHSWQRLSMLGWSPDDTLLAYAFPSDPKNRGEEIVVCNGSSGDLVAKITADANLYELAWLTPHSFVYSTDFNYDMKLVEQEPNGEWVNREIFPKVARERPENLTAMSSTSVAWQEGGDIWTLDLTSSLIKKLWSSNTNQLVGFAYSQETKEFLLNCSDNSGQFLIHFSPSSDWVSGPERLPSQQGYISSVACINGTPRYAYSSDNHGNAVFCIQTNVVSTPIRVFWSGSVVINTDGVRNWVLSGNGNCLFFTGVADFKVPGIWEYDIQSGVLHCIISSITEPFAYAKIPTPIVGVVTNASGEVGDYYLWQPAHVLAGRKCGFIVTDQFWNSFPYAQIAANEGYYFAVVDQSYVINLYRNLLKNPDFSIDTNHVYLYASSLHSSFASELFWERHNLWKGAILFCPIALPNLSDLNGKQLLIIDGRSDSVLVGDATFFDRLTEYQDEAAEAGIPVALSFLNGSDHTPASVYSERTRAQRFAKFLAEH